MDLKGSKGPTGDVEKNLSDNSSTRNLYLAAMEERIASSIQGRRMDMAKVYPALAVAIANMPNMRKSLDEAVKASEELERNHPRIPGKTGSVRFQ